MKIRKQVYDLTSDDLAKFPVWEFALDEEGEENQDEATVRPYEFFPPLDISENGVVIKANFAEQDKYLFGTAYLPRNKKISNKIISDSGKLLRRYFL